MKPQALTGGVAQSWLALAFRGASLAIAAVVLTIYVLGPLKGAHWSIIDDHEIAQYAGPTGRLPFTDIPARLLSSEVGYAGFVPRFRPVYYGLRLLESALWGFDPRGWYRARSAMYAFVIVVVGWVLGARIGTLGAMGFLLWVFSAAYWFDVWGRLGPGESYAVGGCALWTLGVHLLWAPAEGPVAVQAAWRQWLGVVFFVVGSAVAMASKETFLVLVAPDLFLLTKETFAGRVAGVRWWACFSSIIVAIAVTVPLIVYFLGHPVDQYGRSVAPSARLAVLAQGVIHPTMLHGAVAFAGALWLGTALAALVWTTRPSPGWRRFTRWFLFASAGALALYLSQVVLYNGDVVPGTRYEFPAAIAGPLLLVAASLQLRALFRGMGAIRAERTVHHVMSVILIGAAVATASGFREQREASRIYARTTTEFTTRVAATAAAVRGAPAVPVVVSLARPQEVEFIFSVERFLRAYHVKNPMFLILDWQSSRREWTPREAFLAPSFEKLAREGGAGYEPLGKFDPKAPCFGVGIGEESHRGCRGVGRLW